MDKANIRMIEKQAGRRDHQQGRPRRRIGHLDEFTVGDGANNRLIRARLQSL